MSILMTPVVFFGLVLAQEAPDSAVRGTKQFRQSMLVSGLAGPWELTLGPDGMLWVTERTGKRVTRIDPTSGERAVAITIDEVSAPGGQDGLLGMALHPELLQGTGNDYVYVAYTSVDEGEGADANISHASSRYRYLYGKIVRLAYNEPDGTLSDPVGLITGLPAGNDHVAGRLKFGPDGKLYFTIGDQGHNQLGNYCFPIEAQRLPTQEELDDKNYVAYVGKSLRLNLDGSVPEDNPRLAGVVSHVYTYGYRNPQGIDFGPDGTLYSSEHGPKTDDEVNILKPGANYGWPHVAGRQDNMAYEYARWADASTPCSELRFSDLAIHPSVPREPESAFTKPFVEPIATMFTVPSDYDFHDPVCKGVDFLCWPTVGASSIEYYQSKREAIPGWDGVLLVTTLKRGSLYVVPLTAERQAAAGNPHRYFQFGNRFRDTAFSPDGETIYIATDPRGPAEAPGGGVAWRVKNPGAILAYTYEGEGGPAATDERKISKEQTTDETQTVAAGDGTAAGMPPQFTTEQARAGKTAYDSTCAVCHGSTMTNGTFGTPLAGEYFKNAWFGRSVRAFYDHTKAMPPAAPASLPDDTYANIVAYVLDVNGFEPGTAELSPGGTELDNMTIR